MTVEMSHTFFNWKGGGLIQNILTKKNLPKIMKIVILIREMWGKDSVV